MGIIKGLAGRKHDFHNFADGQEVLGFAKCLEVGAVDIFHGNITEIFIHPCVINGHDAGMHQPADDPVDDGDAVYTILVGPVPGGSCGRS